MLNRTEDKNEFYKKDWFVLMAILLFFPVGLYLMFRYSDWSIKTKISIILAIPIIIFVLIVDISPPIDKIEITPNAVNMELDTIKILDVKCEPANANKDNLVYVSTDMSVARAENGRIYSVGTGKTKIYAYDKKSGVNSDIIYVTVCTSIISAEERKALAEEIISDEKKLENDVPKEKVIKEETEWTKADDVKTYVKAESSNDEYEAGKVISSETVSNEESQEPKESSSETGETEENTSSESQTVSGDVVYIGKSGNKYHKKDCSTLKGGGTAILRRDATLDGREPCKRCKP